MPSSISNSKARSWVKSWILAFVIAALLLSSLEIFWRSNGHLPAIIDDQRLWAMERSKIGKSQNEIVLLGSSRMQTDISIATMRRLAPNRSIINLSADSTCANAVLHDLARDNNFKGTVIMETTSECLMFGDSPELSQQFYVDYFHKTYNLNLELNRIIATFIQKHITIVDPYLNMIKVAGDLFIRKTWRKPNYIKTHEDRSRSADYSKLDITRHKTSRLMKVSAQYQQLAPGTSTEILINRVSNLDNAVIKILNRGGKVVFVRFPVSAEHWLIDEKYFPRDKYWNSLSAITKAQILHFKDIEGVSDLQCPDTSHLDLKDTQKFTAKLNNKLVESGIL